MVFHVFLNKLLCVLSVLYLLFSTIWVNFGSTYIGTDKQACKDVVDDGHPILLITASDIASILRNNSINKENVMDWLKFLDDQEKQ